VLLTLALSLLQVPSARADTPAAVPAEPPRIEPLLGASIHAFQYPLLYEGIPIRAGVGVEYGLRLPVGVEVGAAIRLVAPAKAEPTWAVEGALRVDAVAMIGQWRPAAGVEVGASSRSTSEVLEEERPPGSYFADLGQPEPLWIDVTATPLRLRFDTWELGVARLGVGVSLLTPGMSGRWRADLLTVARVF